MGSYAEALAEVKAYIDGLVSENVDIDRLARDLVDAGMSHWDGHQKEAYTEIRGSYTRSGHPIPFSFTAVTED